MISLRPVAVTDDEASYLSSVDYMYNWSVLLHLSAFRLTEQNGLYSM